MAACLRIDIKTIPWPFNVEYALRPSIITVSSTDQLLGSRFRDGPSLTDAL